MEYGAVVCVNRQPERVDDRFCHRVSNLRRTIGGT
jgi:hypothetical protein